MKVSMTKYCVNCKHFVPKADDPNHLYARCSGGTLPLPVSLVTGLPRYGSELKYAEVRRMPSETCGPDGNQYEENTNV